MLNLLNLRQALRQRLGAVVAALVGSAGCCVCGLLMTFVLAPRQALQASSIARLPVMSPADVSAADPGDTILITGVLAGNALLRADSELVVYTEAEWEVTVPNTEDSGESAPHGVWRSRRNQTPELTLEAGGQPLVLHAAESVQLSGALREESVPSDSDLLADDAGTPVADGTVRYAGLADGDLTTVLGEKSSVGGVTPEHLFGGDRTGFEESQRQAAGNFLIAGLFSLVMAPVVLIGGVLAALFARRR
jgi:hypothetical protein